MSLRFVKHLVLPALTLGLTLAGWTPVHAQDATFQVRFGTRRPHWESVRGTHVRVVRDTDRPDYDVFRYQGNYYAYNNNRWYRSRHQDGDYVVVEDRDVPRDFSRVPRERWRNYPQTWPNWSDDNDRHHHHHQH